MTSLPTLDVQLADPLLAASTHSRRNILISAATVLAALVPALGNYLGFDSQMNTANLLDNNSLRLDWQPTSVIFAEFNLPYFLVPLLTPFSSLYWDKITKTALTTKLDRFVADMDAHRAHVRDKILHEHLSEHDADEIAADLENHKSIAFVNTQKLLARRQSIARASFHPWVIVFATLTLYFVLERFSALPVESANLLNAGNSFTSAWFGATVVMMIKGYHSSRVQPRRTYIFQAS